MASSLTQVPAFRSAMQELEDKKLKTSKGVDYWMARDLMTVLGYVDWENFENVIEKARANFRGVNEDPSHHILETTVMMEVGKGAMREGADHFLDRHACYLIALNGDPIKPQIAAAKQYFAEQTRLMELHEQTSKDITRIRVRERFGNAVKRVGDIAKEVGVGRFDWFHAARWHGMYGKKSIREIRQAKGVPEGEDILDRLGSWELSSHEFQIGLAARRILDENVTGQEAAIAVNKEVAESVRQTIIDNIGYGPEDVPIVESIKDVEKRLKADRRPKALSAPTS